MIFTLVINTLVSKGPIIFLKMAEGNMGEYDGIISSIYITNTFDSKSFNYEGLYLNYSKVEELYQKKYNLSPRKYMCGVEIGSDISNMNIITNDTTSINKW